MPTLKPLVHPSIIYFESLYSLNFSFHTCIGNLYLQLSSDFFDDKFEICCFSRDNSYKSAKETKTRLKFVSNETQIKY